MPTKSVTTAGMFLCYAVETTPGERPTTGYLVVPEVKTMPSFSVTPEALDNTNLLEESNKTYLDGLKDFGGALNYTANYGDVILDFWKKCIKAYEEAEAQGLNMWWCVVHPKVETASFYPGKPAPIGMDEANVNAVAETALNVMPTGSVVQEDKPTLAPEEDQDPAVRPYLKNKGMYPTTMSARSSSEAKEVEV